MYRGRLVHANMKSSLGTLESICFFTGAMEGCEEKIQSVTAVGWSLHRYNLIKVGECGAGNTAGHPCFCLGTLTKCVHRNGLLN